MSLSKAEEAALDHLLDRLTYDPDEFIPTAITPDEILQSAELLGGSLRLFVPEAWRLVDPAPFVPNWHIDAICEHLDGVSAGDIHDLIISVPPRSSKALCHETPVFTTWGWKRHGDLSVGDFVFGPDGQPKRVLACTEDTLDVCYEVEFDDGALIIASAGHLWEIDRDVMSDAPRYSRCRKKVVVETRELRSTGYNKREDIDRRPDRIVLASPIQLPPKRLLIDPYTLGAWIGDGNSQSGVIYSAEQDSYILQTLGRVSQVCPPDGTRKQVFLHILIEGLSRKLRALGLMGNKHIPQDYMESSVQQRLDLLAGLMDTDGTCSTEGTCYFSTKSLKLAQDVKTLGHTLGLKTGVTSHEAKIGSRSYGLHHLVHFVPPTGMKVFRLKRKQDRVRGNLNGRSRHRYIANLSCVGLRPVKCIQVEGNIYLAGKDLVPTHNSSIISVIWPVFEWISQPYQQWLFSSYAFGLSLRDSVKRRRIIKSEWYQSRWGKKVQLVEDQDTKARFANDRRGYMMAVSTESAVTGEGGSRLIADDPNDVKKRESEIVSAQTLDWFNVTWSTRRNSPQAARVVVQQRTRENDVTGDCLERGGWMHLKLPTEFDPKSRCITSWTDHRTGKEHIWTDPRVKEGELLNPIRFGPEEVEEAKLELGTFQWASQHAQNPVPPEGTIIRADWLRYYGGPSAMEIPEFSTMRGMWTPLLSVDCAFKDNKDSDYVAGLVWAMRGADIFLLPICFHAKLSFTGTLDAIAMMVGGTSVDGKDTFPGTYPFIKVKLVEDKANGTAVIDTLRHRIAGMIPFDPGNASKTSRLESVSWRFRAGNVYLPHEAICPWIKDYVWEVLSFPRARRDDFVDATSQALLFIGGDPQVQGVPVESKRSSPWELATEDTGFSVGGDDWEGESAWGAIDTATGTRSRWKSGSRRGSTSDPSR